MPVIASPSVPVAVVELNCFDAAAHHASGGHEEEGIGDVIAWVDAPADLVGDGMELGEDFGSLSAGWRGECANALVRAEGLLGL